MVDRFVDQSISGSCSNYNPTSRNCLGGTEQAYSSYSAAHSAGNAGDRILMRSGSNYSNISVTKNFAYVGGYLDEVANIAYSGSSNAIEFNSRNSVHIRNISTSNANGYMSMDNSDNCLLENLTFAGGRHSGGTSSGLRLQESNRNVIFNCSFTGNNNTGYDLMCLRHRCDFNRIINCTFFRAGHTLLAIKCSNNNIIRYCTFDNPVQKACEIYDCPSTGPGLTDRTRNNIYEYNKWTNTLTSDAPHRHNGIQWCGQNNLVRFNEFYECDGGAVRFQNYSGSCGTNYGNISFSNTYLENECYALTVDGSSPTRQLRTVNDLYVRNSPCESSPPGTQIQLTAAVIDNRGNLQVALVDPGFVDMAGRDLDYLPGSDMSGAGVWAATVSSGVSNSVTVPVSHSRFFFDGYGIGANNGFPAEEGDWVRFEGTETRRQIASINYDNDVMTLTQAVTVANGVGVHPDYDGSAPNAGHFRGDDVIVTNRILTGWEPLGSKNTGQTGTILEYEDPTV